MNTPKNVQIPYDDFLLLIVILEYMDTSNSSQDFIYLHESILKSLKEKKKRIELREDYRRLINANRSGDDDKALEARIDYFKKRNNLKL